MAAMFFGHPLDIAELPVRGIFQKNNNAFLQRISLASLALFSLQSVSPPLSGGVKWQ